MKKKLLFLASLVICIAIAASGTMAYFTAEEKVHNVITTDGVSIQVEEWQETDEGWEPYPKEPIKVMPTTTVSKIATFKNLEAPCYIRASYEIVVKGSDGKEIELSQDTLESIISINTNTADWVRKDGDDKWWYYNEAVATGIATKPLFTEVAFDGPNMTNEYQNCTIEIIVSAQAVQTANNGTSAVAANGWPKNEEGGKTE